MILTDIGCKCRKKRACGFSVNRVQPFLFRLNFHAEEENSDIEDVEDWPEEVGPQRDKELVMILLGFPPKKMEEKSGKTKIKSQNVWLANWREE